MKSFILVFAFLIATTGQAAELSGYWMEWNVLCNGASPSARCALDGINAFHKQKMHSAWCKLLPKFVASGVQWQNHMPKGAVVHLQGALLRKLLNAEPQMVGDFAVPRLTFIRRDGVSNADIALLGLDTARARLVGRLSKAIFDFMLLVPVILVLLVPLALATVFFALLYTALYLINMLDAMDPPEEDMNPPEEDHDRVETDRLDQPEEDRDRLETNLDRLEDDLDRIEGDHDRLKEDLDRLEKNLDRL